MQSSIQHSCNRSLVPAAATVAAPSAITSTAISSWTAIHAGRRPAVAIHEHAAMTRRIRRVSRAALRSARDVDDDQDSDQHQQPKHEHRVLLDILIDSSDRTALTLLACFPVTLTADRTFDAYRFEL